MAHTNPAPGINTATIAGGVQVPADRVWSERRADLLDRAAATRAGHLWVRDTQAISAAIDELDWQVLDPSDVEAGEYDCRCPRAPCPTVRSANSG